MWLVNRCLSVYVIILQGKFFNPKNSCVREELIDLPFFLQTQLQNITVQEHIFSEFALAPLTFGPCTSPTDTFPFTYNFPSVPIPICQSLNCSPICTVENFQRLQRQIKILDNLCQRRGSNFWFPYTLQSSGNLFWCTTAHMPEAHMNQLNLSIRTFDLR